MGELAKVANRIVVKRRAALYELQEWCETLPDQIVPEETVTHHFSPGVYTREFKMDANYVAVGYILREACLCVLVQGKMRVADENGTRDVEAPHIWQSTVGIKRAAVFLEDTIWLTIHPNPDEERDVDVLHTRIFTDSYETIENDIRENIE